MSQLVTAAGILAVTAGAAMVHPAAGLVTGGSFLILIGVRGATRQGG